MTKPIAAISVLIGFVLVFPSCADGDPAAAKPDSGSEAGISRIAIGNQETDAEVISGSTQESFSIIFSMKPGNSKNKALNDYGRRAEIACISALQPEFLSAKEWDSLFEGASRRFTKLSPGEMRDLCAFFLPKLSESGVSSLMFSYGLDVGRLLAFEKIKITEAGEFLQKGLSDDSQRGILNASIAAGLRMAPIETRVGLLNDVGRELDDIIADSIVKESVADSEYFGKLEAITDDKNRTDAYKNSIKFLLDKEPGIISEFILSQPKSKSELRKIGAEAVVEYCQAQKDPAGEAEWTKILEE